MLFHYLIENLATILVGIVVLAILSAVAVKLWKDKKNHKTSCGCNCAGCLSAGKCSQTYNRLKNGER